MILPLDTKFQVQFSTYLLYYSVGMLEMHFKVREDAVELSS